MRVRLSAGLRAVAIYEAAKGALVLLAGFELLSLMHRDAQHFAEQLVAHLHLDPAKEYPRIFIDAAANVTDAKLWLLAGFALVYVAIRWIEAYGLWQEKRWAEWLAVASGGIYVPAELYEIVMRVTWTKILLLFVNVCIVVYLIYMLSRSKRNRGDQQAKGDAA